MPNIFKYLKYIRNCSTLSSNKPNSTLIPVKSDKIVPVKRSKLEFHDPQVLSFNIAHYADKSNTVQEFIKLGVDLSKVEKIKGAQEVILRLDFDQVKNYIRFLHDVGVPPEELGRFFTKNPFIFNEDIENLQVRINYLESKDFTPDNISRIVTHNPKWLSHSTVEIDTRLGFFQQNFDLKGEEVRLVTTRLPTLITFNMHHVETNRFTVMEQMGFKKDETKLIIIQAPKVFMTSRHKLLDQFDVIHNEMKIPHDLIISQPRVLLSRPNRTKERHLYLKALGRDQYDPTKANYISPMTIIACDDALFATNVAKTSVALYNKFLKTIFVVEEIKKMVKLSQ